jgi:hypothetical protein
MPNRRTVGVYERPGPMRRRHIWVPLTVALAVLAAWVVFFVIP